MSATVSVTQTYANAAASLVRSFVVASYPESVAGATSCGAANRKPTPRIVVM